MIEMAHRHGATRARRRRAGGLAHAGRRAGARLRLLRVLRPQDLRADRHRRRLRQARASSRTMPPWQGGGNMIADVTFEKTIYQRAAGRFEAGTGNIADAVGLGAALDYVDADRHGQHRSATSTSCSSTRTERLLDGARACASSAPRRRRPACCRSSSTGQRTEDVGAALDQRGHRRALRPPLRAADPAPLRAREHGARRRSRSTTRCEDIDALVAALLRIQAGRGHRGL